MATDWEEPPCDMEEILRAPLRVGLEGLIAEREVIAPVFPTHSIFGSRQASTKVSNPESSTHGHIHYAFFHSEVMLSEDKKWVEAEKERLGEYEEWLDQQKDRLKEEEGWLQEERDELEQDKMWLQEEKDWLQKEKEWLGEEKSRFLEGGENLDRMKNGERRELEQDVAQWLEERYKPEEKHLGREDRSASIEHSARIQALQTPPPTLSSMALSVRDDGFNHMLFTEGPDTPVSECVDILEENDKEVETPPSGPSENALQITPTSSTTDTPKDSPQNEWLVARQVGVVTLQIQELSLSAHEVSSEDISVSAGEGDDSNTSPDEPDEAPNSAQPETETPAGPSHSTSTTTSQGATSDASSGFHLPPGDTSGEEDKNRRKRRRQRAGPRIPALGANASTPLRLACPYQAYEPWRGCLGPGARNPRGGCGDMSRLKQHLARRHMVSYRCRRCWRSFDTRREAAAHPEDGNCSIKERPATERFMRADDESVVEAYAGNAVDVWWALFRVLVPEVYGVDDDVLKTLYFPYYGAQAMAPIFLPPVTLPDHILQSVPATPWHGDTGVTDHLNPNLAQASLAAPTSFPARSSLSTAPVSAYTFNSQAFSLPIYQMTVSSAPPTQTPADNSVASLDFDIFDTDMDPSGLIHMSLEPPPPHVTPPEEPSPPHLQSQVQQRLYDRLAQRLEQAEAENETLREANRVNRAELIRMEKLLESVLATETTLGENAYERLSQVANMTVAVKKRMVC